MIYKVELSQQAEADIDGIYEYIAYRLLAPENAQGQLVRLEDAILGLEHMPYKFRRCEAEPWHSREVRIMPVDNFVVLYIPNEVEEMVTVIRVMYGGMDIERELSDYTKL